MDRLKEHWIYHIGKTITEVCPDKKFNAKKYKYGLFLWKFPNNLLFTFYIYGEKDASIVMEEKAFRGIYEAMDSMETGRAYKLTRNGISKRCMKEKTFKKKIENDSLTPDVYITKGKESIVFWICDEQQTLETLSISFSQMGEIYEKLKEEKTWKE